MPGWDKQIDYETVRRRLDSELAWRSKNTEDVRNRRAVANLCVLYTQLENGCRVGEAVSAVREWASTGATELRVKVEKRRDNYYRLVIIPTYIRGLKINPLDVRYGAVKTYAFRLGFNTHSLRYAFITRLAQKGVNPAVLAKITGHKNLNMLLHYLQKSAGEKVLREVVS